MQLCSCHQHFLLTIIDHLLSWSKNTIWSILQRQKRLCATEKEGVLFNLHKLTTLIHLWANFSIGSGKDVYIVTLEDTIQNQHEFQDIGLVTIFLENISRTDEIITRPAHPSCLISQHTACFSRFVFCGISLSAMLPTFNCLACYTLHFVPPIYFWMVHHYLQ